MSTIKAFLIFWIAPIILIIFYYFVSSSKSKKSLNKIRDVETNHKTTRLNFLQCLTIKIHQNFLNLTSVNKLALGLLFIFVCFYIFLVLYQENFSGVDQSIYLFSTLKERGRIYSPPIWVDNGRFWPLGHQEFNVISLITQSPTGYHAFPILQLLIVIAGIFVILEKFPVWFRTCITAFILTTPSFLLSFFGLVYPERNIIFWLVIFLICFQRSFHTSKARGRLFFCCTLVAAQFLLYYKEVVFLLIGGFAAFRLTEAFVKQNVFKQKKYRQFLKLHILEISLLALVGLFFIGYVQFVLLNRLANPHGESYVELFSTSTFYALTFYLKSNLLLSIFLLTFGLRCIYLISFRRSPDLLWDSLAFAAFLYFLSFLKLTLIGDYYLAPVDFIAILYLSQLIYNPFLRDHKQVIAITTSLTFLSVTAWNSVLSLHLLALMKNNTIGQDKLYSFLDNHISHHPSDNLNLFFPLDPTLGGDRQSGLLIANSKHRGWPIMELGAFLEHERLAAVKRKPSSFTDAVFKHPVTLIFKHSSRSVNNLCVNYAEFECLYAQSAQSGDLIVVTPRLAISEEKLKILKQEATLLFHYRNQFPSLFFISDTYVFQKL